VGAFKPLLQLLQLLRHRTAQKQTLPLRAHRTCDRLFIPTIELCSRGITSCESSDQCRDNALHSRCPHKRLFLLFLALGGLLRFGEAKLNNIPWLTGLQAGAR
jgi:hypothetical protein